MSLLREPSNCVSSTRRATVLPMKPSSKMVAFSFRQLWTDGTIMFMMPAVVSLTCCDHLSGHCNLRETGSSIEIYKYWNMSNKNSSIIYIFILCISALFLTSNST
ncbi:hypothetical protein GALMADRAFT_1185289 [Galerina marginata CBS 339.88]|uniref:Uncharacterized protein n=1 Tax=Galerina marginata (strain CBS 339.88) TaxID=685588 RepID=A0A067TJV1_GALM3|nr:hypothetical protein GALMADRAFT_1185289 [Galerina marginata CBS 339.88]